MSSFDPYFRMVLDVESRFEGLIWRGDFQQKYIEEITNKAGSYKKFSIFIKMLLAALKGEQRDEVSVDLLTQGDLALIKQRKQADLSSAQLDHSEVDPQQKRYLILTLNGEFEKVHFPMPLSFLEEPDIATLRKTFTRMQSEMNLMSSSRAFSEMLPDDPMAHSMNDFALVDEENAAMRDQLDEMERVYSQTDTQFFTAQREAEELESQLEQYQKAADVEIDQLMKVVEQKETELNNLQRHLDKVKGTH